MSTKDYDHLLLDGKNALYRAIYAGIGDKNFKDSGNDFFLIFIKFLHKYLEMFSPKSIHVFWDSPTDNVWRKSIYPEYKLNRSDDFDIKRLLNRQLRISIDVLNNMGIRQYYREGMEADDLIYAFCRVCLGDRILIISSDADLKQIIYKYNNIDLHNPLNKNRRRIEETPRLDPVLQKALCGDKADNIPGYYRIGKVKSQALIKDIKRRKEFLESEKAKTMINGNTKIVNDTLFKRNRTLIDLSLCPEVLENMLYVEKRLAGDINFDYSSIIHSLQKRKVTGTIIEASQYIKPFKRLVSRE